uniref:Uncharacterized protein n=1 Tax=Arundo donax TaxID=35708 RepID=A0A0A9AZ63_ARUDO
MDNEKCHLFDQFKLNEPTIIIHKMCSFLIYWVGLQSLEKKQCVKMAQFI